MERAITSWILRCAQDDGGGSDEVFGCPFLQRWCCYVRFSLGSFARLPPSPRLWRTSRMTEWWGKKNCRAARQQPPRNPAINPDTNTLLTKDRLTSSPPFPW